MSSPSASHRFRAGWRAIAALLLGALLVGLPAAGNAAKPTDRAQQKKVAESEHADLRQKLDALKRNINQTETARSHAADALASSESAISTARRKLRELSQEQQQTEEKLHALSQQQLLLQKKLDAQHRQLAKLLREQYVAGNEDRIKLLMSGDNPNRINRDLQYMGYVSRAQAKLVEQVRASLAAVEANQAEVENARDELAEITGEARDQQGVLEKEKAQRATLLSQLSNKLEDQRKQAGNLQRDQQRLASLVDKLTVLIEEQRKAEAAAREKKRQAQLAARAKAERDRRAALAKKRGAEPRNSAGGKITPADRIEDDVAPEQSLARNELTPEPVVHDGAFAALRGQLRLPVRGDLVAKFGSKRGAGPTLKGLFIRADEGADVKAVAAGQVVFADWLRGFGNLVIVDHGSQYLTIYGNNQSLLKRAGAAVKAGEVIASAGNSGGNEQSGLYFEMRHQGRAFDPLGWVTIR